MRKNAVAHEVKLGLQKDFSEYVLSGVLIWHGLKKTSGIWGM